MKEKKEIKVDVSVIIVSYNCRDYLRQCLMSLEKEIKHSGLKVETIVVDNSSTDGTNKMIGLKKYGWVKWIEAENNGFGAGNNLGIKESKGDYIFLLNPDTELKEGCIWQCFEYMQMNKEVGVLGPKVVYGDGVVQISAFDNFPGVISAWLENTLLDRVLYKLWPKRNYPGKLFSRSWHINGQIREVAHVLGAAMWVRRSAYRLVGGFDEKFFLFREETDWQYRIRLAGWHVVYFPEAEVIHYEGKSTGEARFKKESWMKKLNWYLPSVYLFQKKWGSNWSVWWVWAAYVFGSIWTIIVLFFLWLINNTVGWVAGSWRGRINRSIGNIVVYHWAILAWHWGRMWQEI